ncbi:MAG: heterodisulfide reductase-related iron-sulfur binding cluster, partial [Peptostreptococcaceae bacterium]
GIKVTPIWELIIKYGIPKELRNHYNDLSMSFTLHDPCPMRSETKVHNDVREILNSLGLKIEEFEKNRKNSECCGSGGMVRVTKPNISYVQTFRRANNAKTDTVISYCESCCESMLIANKKTLHILDFLFNEEVINKEKFTQNQTSTINKWSERYKGAKINKNGGHKK